MTLDSELPELKRWSNTRLVSDATLLRTSLSHPHLTHVSGCMILYVYWRKKPRPNYTVKSFHVKARVTQQRRGHRRATATMCHPRTIIILINTILDILRRSGSEQSAFREDKLRHADFVSFLRCPPGLFNKGKNVAPCSEMLFEVAKWACIGSLFSCTCCVLFRCPRKLSQLLLLWDRSSMASSPPPSWTLVK